MVIAGLLVFLALLVGCVSATINVSSGTGRHDLGPEEAQLFKTSKESQESTDSIQRLESKISGIDKSQNQIQETVNKTSKTQQDMRDRDEVVDKASPGLTRKARRALYKDKK